MPASFEDQVAAFISRYDLVPPDSHVLVAVSGGPDSCALFLALAAKQKSLSISRLGAIYVDHGFRAETPQEAEFVRNLATAHGAEFFTGQLHLTHDSADEERAREGRYALFAETAAREGFDLVALAHHADDLAETFLINLTRGSGMLGLKALVPRRDIYIRPLLEQRRTDILDYCQKQGITPVTDPTNLQCDYLRNRLRLQLLPLWHQLAERDVTRILVRNCQIMVAEEEYLAGRAAAALNDVTCGQNPLTISRATFLDLPLAMQRRVARLAITAQLPKYYQPSFEQVAQFLAVAQAGRGLLPLTAGFLLYSDEKVLIVGTEEEIVRHTTPSDNFITLPHIGSYKISGGTLTMTIVSKQPVNIPDQTRGCYFAGEGLNWPLAIRTIRPGERMSLLGHRREVKINEILSDLKVPVADRARQIVLVDSKDNILWLLGYRRSAVAPLDEETKEIIYMEIKNGQ